LVLVSWYYKSIQTKEKSLGYTTEEISAWREEFFEFWADGITPNSVLEERFWESVQMNAPLETPAPSA
jgi:hypothetical protein